MTYIVVSSNEIVKAEMERPDKVDANMHPEYIPDYLKLVEDFDKHIASLPRIAIQGKHNWKVWQEVVEGKDFTLGKQFLNENDEWQELHFFKSIWDDLNDEYKRVVAIPMVEQTKSEQVGDVREGLIRLRNYFGEHDRTPFEHWAYNFINNLLTNDNPQTP